MLKGRRHAIGFFVGFALLLVAVVSSCSSSSKAVALGTGCAINSDCSNPLICAYGLVPRRVRRVAGLQRGYVPAPGRV